MKLKILREHFQNPDAAPSGLTWVPKIPFESEEEAKESGLLTSKKETYTCGLCSKLHLKTTKKGK